MSLTTRCRPRRVPAGMSSHGMPVVRVIEQAEPGGVSWTTPTPSAGRTSASAGEARGAAVDVSGEAELVGVERLGPVDVGDWYRNEFEQEHAGTHGWCTVGGDVGRAGRDLGLGG